MVEEPALGVIVRTSRTMSTTSTVIHHHGHAILVDPAWHCDELTALADLLSARSLTPVLGWSTHAHHDHLLWHPRFGNPPRLASAAAVDAARTHLPEIREALDLPAPLLALAGQIHPHDGGQLPWSGPPIDVLTHHAHAPGHSALWLPQQRVLIAGDMLSDTEIPLRQGCTRAEYRTGLDLLAPYVEQALALIPGHGSIAHVGTPDSPTARLATDYTYLDELNRADAVDPRLRDAPQWLLDAHRENLT